MRKLSLTLLVIAIATLGAQAQRYLGMATSNWSGTNSLYLNPANIADSRHKFTIDLFSLNLGFDNDFGQVRTSNITKGDSISSINSIFKLGNKDQFNMLAPYVEVRGPGFMVSINNKHSLALTTRVRAFNQLNNFDRRLYNTISNVAESGTGSAPISVTSKDFSLNSNVWSEIGLTYGVVLYEKKQHMLKAGITGRYIMGAYYANMTGDNLDATFYPGQDSLQVNNTSVKFSSNLTNSDQFNNPSNLLSNALGGNGTGWGADIGVVYEWRPGFPDKYNYELDGVKRLDRSVNTYKLRVSAAVTDLGGMTYKKNNMLYTFKGNGSLSANQAAADFENGAHDIVQYAKDKGFAIDSMPTSTKMTLPTAIVASVDYNIYKRVYVNAMYMGSVANKVTGNYIYNQISVTPRYDSRVFSFGLPITYNMQSKSIKAGAGLRVAGFFLGSDDLLAAFSDNQYGVNFYFGAYVPFNKKFKLHDRDKDHVSNKKDLCPTIPGNYTGKGCPDKDQDSVADDKDRCPDVAGVIALKGCPDRDNDSIPDIDDRCPDVAGTAANKGCPDTDGDGLVDIDDRCPDVAGTEANKGCPDTDGDGVVDIDDKCPSQAGVAAFQGCPDSDGDGIPDNEDRCPTQAGSTANKGCPEIREEVKKRLAFAATAVEFETGKAVIKKKSFALLDEIVAILVEYKDYYMTIDGYTDNVGKADKNLKLSRERAESVKNYFVGKGIASDRIVTQGHGMENPVASNKTAAGRAKNRRVEMDLKLKQ